MRELPEDAVRRSRDDRGFTLPELLIALVLGMIVIGATVMVFTAAIRSQPRVDTQASAIQQARVAMENMIRELRQGSWVPSASASQVAVVTYVHNATCGTTTPVCRVTYSCATDGTCTRAISHPDGTSAAAPVRIVSGLASNNVFVYVPPTTTAPASVGVTLAFPGESGGNAITLSDSATLRNPSAS